MTAEPFWPHDEQLLRSVMDWSRHRIAGGQDPMARARPVHELREALGDTVVPGGIGGHEALRLFTQVVVTATRAQDNPMNLAFIPAAPTEAALVFD
ncbi:MAG TPA: aspartate aminotransferase family protein, partial [Acidimicrobiaceae bacterium]|nr:aspartate aminotransferase family protein [Acidimicrobiaceae bacterium]